MRLSIHLIWGVKQSVNQRQRLSIDLIGLLNRTKSASLADLKLIFDNEKKEVVLNQS